MKRNNQSFKRMLISVICAGTLLTSLAYANEESFIQNENNTKVWNNFFKINKTDKYSIENLDKTYNQFYKELHGKEYRSAEKHLKKIEKITQELSRTNPDIVKYLYLAKGRYNTINSNTDEAISNFNKYYEEVKTGNSQDKLEYYKEMLMIYRQKNDLDSMLQTLNNIEKLPNLNVHEKLALYREYTDIQFIMGNIASCEKYLTKYYNTAVKEYGKNNINLAEYYAAKIHYEMQKGNLKAIPQLLKRISQLKKPADRIAQLETEYQINHIKFKYYKEINDVENMRTILNKTNKIVKELDRQEYNDSFIDFQIDYYRAIKRHDIALYYTKEKYNRSVGEGNKPTASYIDMESELARTNKDLKESETGLHNVRNELKMLDRYERDTFGLKYGSAYKDASECYKELNNYEKAILYAQKAVEEANKFPKDKQTNIDYRGNLANIQKDFGHNEEAIPYYKFIIKENEKMGAENQIDPYKDQAIAYANMNKKQLAMKSIEKAIRLTEKQYGKNNIKTYNVMLDKAVIYKRIGKEKESREIINKIISAYLNKQINGYDADFLRDVNLIISNNKREGGDIIGSLDYAKAAQKYTTDKKGKKDINELIKNLEKQIKEIKKTL